MTEKVYRLSEVFPLAAPRAFYRLRVVAYTTEGKEVRGVPVTVTRTTAVPIFAPPPLECSTPCEWKRLPRGAYTLTVPDSIEVAGRPHVFKEFKEVEIPPR